ncbi:MAG: patatin-like phospholipase family protein [Nitrospirota bacterium]|nr:patatin-like phospholipase family protein [Nitrospirota bacterium]
MRSKVALALSGGGFTGYLFEIGALAALDDLFEDGFTVNEFDLYIGVSAGSAAASLIANGISPAEIFQANVTGERPYYFERRDIFVPAMDQGFTSMARAVRQFGAICKLYLRNRREMSLIELLEKVQQTLPCGIYTLDPFAQYLERTFSIKGLANDFPSLPHPLYIPAIDLEDGQSVLFGDEGWQHIPISKAIIASSAAPIYFCPVRIADRDYIDAGIGRLACFDVAPKMGVDFMVIIHPSSLIGRGGNRPRPTTTNGQPYRGFLSIADQAARINLEARFSLALDLYIKQSPDRFFVISPQTSEALVFDRSFLSFRDRIDLLSYGYFATVQIIKEDFARIRAVFARHGLSISLAKLDERIKSRLPQLAYISESNRQTCPGAARRPGWSSAY